MKPRKQWRAVGLGLPGFSIYSLARRLNNGVPFGRCTDSPIGRAPDPSRDRLGSGTLGSPARSAIERLSLKWDIFPVARNLAKGEKPLDWVGSSKKDFLTFPAAVRDEMGNALGLAQFGGKHPSAKPWKGQGSGVLEVVEDFQTDTYRAVYTVRFKEVVYVLHAFQKKAPSGIRTARPDVELVERRLKTAQQDYEARYGNPKR